MVSKEFRKIATQVNPTDFTDYRLYLACLYKKLKQSFERYSYIKFTLDCNLGNCNAMYLIIHKNRPLTIKSAKKMMTALGTKGDERAYLLALVEYQSTKVESERVKKFEQVLKAKAKCLRNDWEKDSLAFFSNWYHSAIHELLSLEDSSDSIKWLSQHLKPSIPEAKIKDSLALMKQLNLIAYDKKRRRLFPTNRHITTGSEIQGMIFKTYHHEMLQLAQASLSQDSGSTRDISSVTIGVSDASLEKVKAIITDFRNNLIRFSREEKEKNKIMQINVQAFSISEKVKRKQ